MTAQISLLQLSGIPIAMLLKNSMNIYIYPHIGYVNHLSRLKSAVHVFVCNLLLLALVNFKLIVLSCKALQMLCSSSSQRSIHFQGTTVPTSAASLDSLKSPANCLRYLLHFQMMLRGSGPRGLELFI